MKIGIIGLAQAGKKTVFEALTGHSADSARQAQNQIGAVRVPDARIDFLSNMYEPKKTIYAKTEYLLPGDWTKARDCDALIQVVRNTPIYGQSEPMPLKDVIRLDQELIFSDLVVVEKRLERIAQDQRRGKKPDDPGEEPLLEKCRALLEAETPLRADPEIQAAPGLRGFAFLSAKPQLVLVNNPDEDDDLPNEFAQRLREKVHANAMVIKAKLEQELGQMSKEDAAAFLKEFNLTAPAMERVIQKSYEIMGLISFFTVGKDEVRAWTIGKDTPALDAAEVIHSDIKKGFIRAEVLAYDDLVFAGSYADARKAGTVRLEGKTCPMKDGDIVNFRFNV